MTSGDLLSIHPSELKFPFELRKQSSCSIQLVNKTDKYVAFEVKTTNPKNYCVRPKTGVVPPRSACNVTVTMQAPKKEPSDMPCKDKFLLQSVIAADGATTKDITSEMFTKDGSKPVEEFKLQVVYVPAKLPSPVRRSPEEPKHKSSEDLRIEEPGFSFVYMVLFGILGYLIGVIWKITDEFMDELCGNQN